jgi:hypothetical protein
VGFVGMAVPSPYGCFTAAPRKSSSVRFRVTDSKSGTFADMLNKGIEPADPAVLVA